MNPVESAPSLTFSKPSSLMEGNLMGFNMEKVKGRESRNTDSADLTLAGCPCIVSPTAQRAKLSAYALSEKG